MTIRRYIRLCFVCVFACGWQSVEAQTLSVRSGEHDTFTRLVMRLPAKLEWALDDSAPQAQLKVEGDDEKEAFSAVKDMIDDKFGEGE